MKLFNRTAVQAQRPLSAVPRGVVIALALALILQSALRLTQAPPSTETSDFKLMRVSKCGNGLFAFAASRICAKLYPEPASKSSASAGFHVALRCRP